MRVAGAAGAGAAGATAGAGAGAAACSREGPPAGLGTGLFGTGAPVAAALASFATGCPAPHAPTARTMARLMMGRRTRMPHQRGCVAVVSLVAPSVHRPDDN